MMPTTNAKYKPDDWYFDTSATPGRHWPLRSLKLSDTLNCGITLAASIMHAKNPVYAWVDFRRWLPNAEHGTEIISEPSVQIFATRHGFALGFNWEYLLVPHGVQRSQPVLIYNYDADCFLFCDQNHFLKKSVVARYAKPLFSVRNEQPPSVDGLRWAPIREYMDEFELPENEFGCPTHPDYAN